MIDRENHEWKKQRKSVGIRKFVQTYDTYLYINDIEMDHMNINENSILLAAQLFMEKQDGDWQSQVKKMDSVKITIEPGIKEEK